MCSRSVIANTRLCVMMKYSDENRYVDHDNGVLHYLDMFYVVHFLHTTFFSIEERPSSIEEKVQYNRH